jgi:hypothetical protein
LAAALAIAAAVATGSLSPLLRRISANAAPAMNASICAFSMTAAELTVPPKVLCGWGTPLWSAAMNVFKNSLLTLRDSDLWRKHVLHARIFPLKSETSLKVEHWLQKRFGKPFTSKTSALLWVLHRRYFKLTARCE